MKGILLFSLISLLYCEIVPLKKYGLTDFLCDNGFVVLDVSGFNKGDSIYITYIAILESYLSEYIRYIFSDIYPENYDRYLLTEKMYPYSEGQKNPYSTEDSYCSSCYDYYYYFEFTKPNNNVKYLIIEYERANRYYCLKVENTRYRR